MTNSRGIAAVIPIKETIKAKHRLHELLAPAQRRELALTMLQDVLTAVAATSGLAAIVVVTVDPAAAGIARRHGAEVYARDADDGHTAAVAAAARRLAGDGLDMLTLPAESRWCNPRISRACRARAVRRATARAALLSCLPGTSGDRTRCCAPPPTWWR